MSEASGAFVVAFLDELVAEPSMIERWVSQERARPHPVTLLVYAAGEDPGAAEATFVAQLEEVGGDGNATPYVVVTEEADDGLAARVVARYSSRPCSGPLALVPRFARDASWFERYVPEAPVAGELATGPPDFVGVGAQRSGTTWWSSLLSEHPEVWVQQKERQFFNRMRDAAGEDWPVERYHRLFPRPPGRLAGEWTPVYMFCPWVPPMLARAAPDAKLLVLLRDPLERFRSGLTAAIPRGNTRTDQHFERGLYARQLVRLLRYFPREQLLVLQYERCVREPLAQYERTLRFLGVRETGFAPPSLERRAAVTRTEKVTLREEARRAACEAYRADAERLTELVPDLELDLWPSLA